MAEKDAVRRRIAAAARKRFLNFGYGKTTMAAVAADRAMSLAKLHRFFPGKPTVAEALATTDCESHPAQLRRQAQAAA